MKTTKLFSMLFIGFCILSCTNDSEDDLIAIDQEQGNGGGEPGETGVTYANTVRAIIQNSCVGCHADPPRNGAPFALVNFQQVSSRANGILSAMSRDNGSGVMPPSGRLPQNTIDQIQAWIDNDLPEN
ncbi:hypothetical protein MTsPCn9_05070 [Croceitalea sp. MTPC9]|uniref:hypothetical protein n=1 Tax=unclassified Croceitalea TaxID=2632280 RepID=UPI002B381F88|nr:hypothetical protein MTsPCn6_03640 [Croceitalea sp. MTPC6]GMN15571.1 hypothetical protein MTsPCn9_05070 [Croceitalea sp. MTPC9]